MALGPNDYAILAGLMMVGSLPVVLLAMRPDIRRSVPMAQPLAIVWDGLITLGFIAYILWHNGTLGPAPIPPVPTSAPAVHSLTPS